MGESNEILCIGIDVGTTSIKAIAYDLNGQIQGSASVDNETISSRPGRSSQSLRATWENTLQALKTLSGQIDPSQVKSIGVCAQGDGLWLLDEKRAPLRNAILWNDQRANENVERWIMDGTSDRLSRYCRTAIWAGTSGAAYRWLKDHEPDAATRARYAIYCKDWVNFKLTGNLTCDFSDATIPFLDLQIGTYAPQVFELLGVPELERKLLTPQRSFMRNGGLSEDISRQTGLALMTPVAVGSLDVAAMVYGMGLHRLGDAFVILGTTAVAGILIIPEPFTTPPAGATVADVANDKWLRVLAPLCGASALDWYAENVSTHIADSDPVTRAQSIAEIAGQSPPGSNGVTFLPFLDGERAPFVAPNAKASFIGISSSTIQADLARSVMEGVAYSLRHCFASTGHQKPERVFITGGGARNQLWCGILADVLDAEVTVSNESDHGTWGAAQLGATAAGLMKFAPYRQRNESLRTQMPDRNAVLSYDHFYYAYESYLENARKLWGASV